MSKNNKKSFSDNLSSIFAHTLNEDNKQDNPKFLSKSLDEQEAVAVLEHPEEEKEKNVQKKAYRKSFSEGLESFFKDSIEEVIGDGTTVTEVKRGVAKKGNKRVIGIEVLLQSTLFKDFEKELENDHKERYPKTKRVTFVLDTDKVELLKNIARTEKKEMRQIVSGLIEEYLKANGISIKKDKKTSVSKTNMKPKK
jgi:hypothetical protein